MTFLGLWGGHMLGKSSEEKKQLLFYYALYIYYIVLYIKIHGSLQTEGKRLEEKSIGRLFYCMRHFLRNGADCIVILGTLLLCFCLVHIKKPGKNNCQ